MSLRAGDLVKVRPVHEIAATLTDGALESLPFMAEMLEFCGQRMRVAKRANITCYFDPPGSRRGFNSDKIVTLENVRCSGAAHDGCQKACTIFWREEWLRKVEDGPAPGSQAIDQFRQQLTTQPSENVYWCQASEILKITHPIADTERVTRYLTGLWQGNYNILQMIRSVSISLIWKVRSTLFGVYARGPHTKSTPTESLNLQPGEWVEVKPLPRILETLDDRGLNRGLFFSYDMAHYCGRKMRVKSRLDKLIADGSGKMHRFRNTVRLEGPICECSYSGLGMGDCARCEVSYWREIWLQRCEAPTNQ